MTSPSNNTRERDYHEFSTISMPEETRRKLNIGDFWLNQIRCRICNDTIRSKNRHHMQRCSCGAVAVDGGSWHLHRLGDPANYDEQSLKFTHTNEESV